MPQTINSVPEEINFEQLSNLCKLLGIDPNDTVEINIGLTGIKVTVFARDEKGQVLLDGDEAAKHEIFIKVVGSHV